MDTCIGTSKPVTINLNPSSVSSTNIIDVHIENNTIGCSNPIVLQVHSAKNYIIKQQWKNVLCQFQVKPLAPPADKNIFAFDIFAVKAASFLAVKGLTVFFLYLKTPSKFPVSYVNNFCHDKQLSTCQNVWYSWTDMHSSSRMTMSKGDQHDPYLA